MEIRETRQRSILKTVIWRIIAILNSFVILVSTTTDDALLNALFMNITGFIIYYFYERVCNQISYGKVKTEE